ncbi:alpha/beta hydrolase [Limosilactobacillus difficilis]|uniref:alpha/beta hydrolase n=1 Tax=Limosilactobacillus difficilis TaxID=2991838 RepID=UPI0024BA2549|nr:alpha/beta hydrolase [Limosilactobacillus difficilis]
MMNQKTMAKYQQLRQTWKANDDKRDAGLNPHPADVQRLDNISYGNHGKANLLDIYRPSEYSGRLPVIINVHGGGYFYGSKETYQFYGLMMAQAGFAFVNFNYQLAPAVHYPSEINEVNQVFHWVAAHGDQYDFDLKNVFIDGDSAGAQMAEQYITAYTNPHYRKLLHFTQPQLTLRAGLLNCGCYFLERQLAQPSVIDAYFTPTSRQQYHDALQVENYISSDFLPTFVMTATNDPLRDTGVRFDQFLTDRQIPHRFAEYGTIKHPRGHVFHINQQGDPVAYRCNRAEITFLRQHCQK